MFRPKSTLEQWRILQAVVDHGGYAQAALVLNKSQSSLNHAVSKLQEQLGVTLLEVRGRKAYLTKAGETMLRRSRVLTQHIEELELLADNLECGWEPEIRIATEIIYPKTDLYQAICAFYPESRGTRLNIFDTVLTGSEEAIAKQTVDIAIAHHVPTGYLAEPLCTVVMYPVCHPEHPLNQTHSVDADELAQHLQIVVRDSGQKPVEKQGWLKAEQRITVGNFHETLNLLERGLGFAWLPSHLVDSLVAQGRLVRINLKHSSERRINLNLVLPNANKMGPASTRLAQFILAQHQKVLSES